MAVITQLRDEATGDARLLEADADGNLVLWNADGTTQLTKHERRFIWPLGGQFLLDPNEISGWGSVGPIDDSNAQQIGIPGQATLSVNAGGLVFPYDVSLNRFFAWHRNTDAAAEAWGWVIHLQTKTADSAVVSTTYVLDEVADNAGVGPRDYLDDLPQQTDIDLTGVTAAQTISAGTLIGLGVASPTAPNNDQFVQIMGGYFELERV